MPQCVHCKGPMKPSNWKYCSIGCRNKAVSKAKRGTFRQNYMVCRTCGATYLVRRSQTTRSKFCSKKCKRKTID